MSRHRETERVRTRFYIELEAEGDAAALKGELAKLLAATNLARASSRPRSIDAATSC